MVTTRRHPATRHPRHHLPIPRRPAVNPGPLVTIRADKLLTQPNAGCHHFRAQAARAIKNSRLDPDTHDTVWALAIAADNWDGVPQWVRQLLGHS